MSSQTKKMHNSNFYINYKWLNLMETYLYPSNWRGPLSRTTSWRGNLNIKGDIHDIADIEINGMHATPFNKMSMISWLRSNQIDLQFNKDEFNILLPRICETFEDFLLVTLREHEQTHLLECLSESPPDAQYYINELVSQIDWVNNVPVLSCIATSPCIVKWIVQECGVWKEIILNTLNSGTLELALDIPYGDVVYLELSISHNINPVIHRYYVVGKPGVVSGRHLWYRGALYASKMQKNNPWTSVIIPVFHPDDIDRVPIQKPWNQIEWWIYKNNILVDSIDIIKAKYPDSRYKILGEFGDDSVDIQVLKPFEMNSMKLDVHKVYAVCLFDDAGNSDYSRRAGWMMSKLSLPEFDNYTFVENMWLHGVLCQSNSDGVKQYGYGYSFARPPDNEYLWTASLRDIEWREHRDSLQCYKCAYQNFCHQALPMPYVVSDNKTLPWVSVSESHCPLLLALKGC